MAKPVLEGLEEFDESLPKPDLKKGVFSQK